MPYWLYITKAMALDAGLTHEGMLFGVPAWFDGDDSEAPAMATPKVPALRAWCWLGNKLLDVLAHFTPADQVLVSPIKVTGRIVPEVLP